MSREELAQYIESILFALGEGFSRAELSKMLQVDGPAIEAALSYLQERQRAERRGIVLVDDGKTLELRAAPESAALIERVRKEEYARDIGRAGLEVLSAVLYRGPLSRSKIDFIRGVNSSHTLRTLSIRGLVRKVPNPKDERSYLYEPTTELLSHLGVTSVKDLADYQSMQEKLSTLESEQEKQKETS